MISVVETKGLVVAPRLPYMYFILLNTPGYKAAHREATRDQIRKALSEEWKTLGESVRAMYIAMGEKDRQRYEKEMDAAAAGEIERLKEKKQLSMALSCPDDAYYFYEREILGKSIVDKSAANGTD